MVSPAEYLAGLPEPIQEQLASIAREAVGMSGAEKGFAAALFGTVGLHYGLGKGPDAAIPGAQMVAALGVILRLANDEATKDAGVSRPADEGKTDG